MNEEPRKSALRSYQDRMLNQGWRIRFIPHDDPSKTIWYPTNWYALAGAVVFCLAFLGILPGEKSLDWIFWAYIAGGFGFALIGLLLGGRGRRRGWLRINAVCLDREWHSNDEGWWFRLLCKFELEGKTYTVTPAPYWRGFASESAVERFLTKAIGEDGTCCLRVNPKCYTKTQRA